MIRPHLAEMLLDIKYRGESDRYRKKHPFSEDIEATQSILFNPAYTRSRKIKAYRKWLETNQPCVFGSVAAKNERVFICLLEEQDILRMRRGDDDLRETIQDYRQVWKRYALEGLSSSFLIVLVSKSLAYKEPGDRLKEICRRLLELYMEVEPIPDDTILNQREYVFLRQRIDGNTRILKFSTLPNVFCAQGDGRWWRDHRSPGGVMITSNALGHFVYSWHKVAVLEDKERHWALRNAMQTIANAYQGGRRSKTSALCPATYLVPCPESETSPLADSPKFRGYSTDHYEGYFHTDHLIPSVFFNDKVDPTQVRRHDNLTFRYIFDPTVDPQEHRELMLGVEANWYDVRMNTDRLPGFANPEKAGDFSDLTKGRLRNWLETKLKEKLDP